MAQSLIRLYVGTLFSAYFLMERLDKRHKVIYNVKYNNKEQNNMQLDHLFMAETYAKYGDHLNSVISSINQLQESYSRQEQEMIRLTKFKPEVYQIRLDEVRNKIKEADIKLSFIIPRMEKMYEEILKVGVLDEDVQKKVDKVFANFKK